jgi:aspartyl-tRNA(Asn)/glutamyl-tRNA(Gln) amidotransferase subunit C
MAIDHTTVERTAHLARIRLDEGDAEELYGRLNEILGLVDQLQQANVEGVEPMAHPLDLNQPLRPDEVTGGDYRDRILKLAPAEEKGCFLVPRVIE